MKSRDYYRRNIRNKNNKESIYEQCEYLKNRNKKLEKENRILRSQNRTLEYAFKKTIDKLEQYQETKSVEDILNEIKEESDGEKEETNKEAEVD